MQEETRVEWRQWGQDAFDEARERSVPVLLSLSTTWCVDCHEMDATTYADPNIAANLNDRYVPVRVDADREPRIRERYAAGGFPSTVFLTPDGEVISTATALAPDGMRQVLNRVAETYAEKGDDAGRVPRALAGDLPPAGAVDATIEEQLAGQLGEKFDERFAGWGESAKFPLARTAEFALKRERQQALRTLDAVRDHLHDEVAGGFFRYAGRRDWGDVHHAKLLDTNATLLRAFAHAYVYTGEDAYREPAESTIDFLTDDLWSGVAVGGSMGPGEGVEYWGKDAAGRADARQPRTDLTAYAGGNALAADALLAYYGYTDDERAREYADRILDYLERDLIEHGSVVHFRERGQAGPRDTLSDLAAVVGAFTRAEQTIGYGAGVAATVADHAIEALHDDGSFRDGPAEGPGLLDRPLRPLDGNAAMANALVDLATLTGDDEYREVARETVGAFAGASHRIGVQVAEYGTAASRLVHDPLTIAVADDPGSDLHRAALRVADHEKVVVPNAGDSIAPELDRGTARVVGVDEPASDPEALMGRVADRQ
ncbi:DUF255 domain-containing protein [Halolamina litorea]|uniref:DUF255 domain-containing protein n=1 Tax=Halolamina litorea TaxID=1515593 RepID=A0ABD6BT01_9EURY|nr:DUF255 domain-containing protein [Halolamina litorea]